MLQLDGFYFIVCKDIGLVFMVVSILGQAELKSETCI